MSDTFNMPKDFGELCEQYAFHDIKEIYTNGSELIQTYRVEQWIEMNGIEEALKKQAAKQATSNYTSEWIPVSERLPEGENEVLITVNGKFNNITFDNAVEKGFYCEDDGWIIDGYLDWITPEVTAWQPLPPAFKAKNADYGDSFAKVREEYPEAICIRLMDKLERLKTLLRGAEQQVEDESIDDTLLDIANYAVMEILERKIGGANG